MVRQDAGTDTAEIKQNKYMTEAAVSAAGRRALSAGRQLFAYVSMQEMRQ